VYLKAPHINEHLLDESCMRYSSKAFLIQALDEIARSRENHEEAGIESAMFRFDASASTCSLQSWDQIIFSPRDKRGTRPVVYYSTICI
jgi:hypothetical protein